MESIIQPSSQELAYRSKHYHDIQIIKEREQKCCSCGNLISTATGKIVSHFALGILQCLVCYNRINELDFTNETVIQKYCVCCGYSATGYTCSNGNCRYNFCRKCIKRNASLALLNAETGQWKCFICEPKPLWDLRGVCAAIMLPHARRMKNASTHSSYAKSRITKTKNMKRSLRGLCDDDNSPIDMDEDLIITTGSCDSDDNEEACNASVSRSRNTTTKLNRSETSNKNLSKKNEHSKQSKSRQYTKHIITGDINKMNTRTVIHRVSTDSDDEILRPKLKATERTANHGKAEKLTENDFDSESSSKEFQYPKKILNKTSKTDTKESKSGTSISKEQSICFKLRVVKILNRFKDLCSEYEIHMESLKVKHFRKKVLHMETAEEIVHKLSSVIHKMTTSLQEQENKLNQFFIMFKEELSMHKEDSDSEDISVSDEEAGLEETEDINQTNKRLTDDKQSDDVSSLKQSKDKVELQNEGDILKTTKKKQKNIFLSSDSEEEKIKKQTLKQDACSGKKGTVETDSTENSKLSLIKGKNEKQEEQLKSSKRNNATPSNKDKCDFLEIDSEASGYDVDEIFSDEEINSQQTSSKESTTENLRTKLVEQDKNDELIQGKEIPTSTNNQVSETDLVKNTNLNEIVKAKKKDCTQKVTYKENSKKTNKNNQREREENSDVLDKSKEKHDVVMQKVAQREDILEESAKDKSEKQTINAEEILLKNKNSTLRPEASDVSTRSEENILNKIIDTAENIGDTNLSTKSPHSSILKCTKSLERLASNEMNESIDDIFDSTSERGETNVNLIESLDQNTTTKDLIAHDKDVPAKNEIDTGNISSTDKMKQGPNLQVKTKPTESTKKETLRTEASEEPNEKVKGYIDFKEERAKKMMLESDDSESEDQINAEDAFEKSSKHAKRGRSKNSNKTDSTELHEEKNEEGHSPTNDLDDEIFADQAQKTGGTEDKNLKETEKSNKQKGEGNIKKSTKKDKTAENSKEQETVLETSGADTNNALKSREIDCDIASDTTEILVLDSSYEQDKDGDTALTLVETIKKETIEKEFSEETEEKAKKALLDSNSDDSTRTNNFQSELNKKRGKKIWKNHSSNSDSSENETHALPRKLRKRKVDRRESTSSRTKRRRHQFDVDRFQDPKLEMGCTVVIRRMSGELLEKYEKALKRSKLRLDRKAIKNLIDLEKLGRDQKRETWNATDTWTQLKRTAKKEKSKGTKSTLMDHLDLNKTENDQNSDGEEKNRSNSDEENTNMAKSKCQMQTNKELMHEADMASKALLLNSSDSDIDIETVNDNASDEDNTERKKSTRKTTDKRKAQSDKKDADDYDKSRWRRCKVLTCRVSDLDESDELKQCKMTKEKLDAQDAMIKEERDNEKQVIPRKRRLRRRIIDSDSNADSPSENFDSDYDELEKSSKDSDSSIGKSKKKRPKPSDSDSSLAEKRPKPKRKRIKKMASDSDSDNDKIPDSQETSGGKGRKNIRKVMKDKQVAEDTKQAAKEEEERLKRISERQRIYNEMYEARLAGEKKVEKLVLDFNPDTKEELITVDPNLVKRLKPHQAEGIKFMWDACYESVERSKSTPGSGCIIAHCMGLGKSLQVVTLVHTLLTYEEIGVKTVLIVCPLSTVLNWMNEFEIWLKDVENCDDINVYEITRLKKNYERKCKLEYWHRTSGVMIVSYNMFRNLTGSRLVGKKMKESFLRSLIDPGPDLVICDEGHLLKNEGTALSMCMKKVKTLRRIVLTGTPLQNNLTEYHCMVQFVKPNLLGTKREFLNRFVNPITNGQFGDSTDNDVKLMKKRAYVLHKMLKGCVQRFDYSVLMPFLPPKQEYVIFVTLTDVQIKMYKHYLDNLTKRHGATSGLFADFQALQRIWTHPIVLQLNSVKVNEKKCYSSDSEGSIKDFIKDSTSESESNDNSVLNDSTDDDEVQTIHDSRDQNVETAKNSDAGILLNAEAENTTEKEEANKEEKEWWMEYAQPEHFEDMRTSSKLVLLFGILKECEEIGDKVLVFSQSLYSLTLIERFLERIDEHTRKGTTSENLLNHTGNWTLGLDYFRLDGQTSADNRRTWCRIFNRPDNTRARLFLISTRAGGLGINLTAANRVIIFDASWNPSHDVQSIFRVYRFGQKKPCYVYRFLAFGTMEEKIYNRQVTKLSLSCRVIDEQQIERHYSNHNLHELYQFETNEGEQKQTLALPKDRLLAEIFLKYKNHVENYHEHDSLLENKVEEELDEEERKQAWLEYEDEKKGKIPQSFMPIPIYPGHIIPNQFDMPTSSAAAVHINYDSLQQLISKDYPNATPEQQMTMTKRAVQEMYNYWEQQAMLRPNASLMAQSSTAGNMPRHRPTILRPQMTPTTTVPQITQVHSGANINPNFVANPFVYRNVEANPSPILDDDIVEVPANTVLTQTHHSNNKNKVEEE